MPASYHDVDVQLSTIQQCLSSGKKPIALFLGAGCPMAVKLPSGEPIIPDVRGITCEITRLLASDQDLSSLLNTATANLRQDGLPQPNVQDILTHIRSLVSVAGSETVRGLNADQLARLDTAICDHVHSIVNQELPALHTPYHYLSSWIRSIPRDVPIEIFTTNYDLLLEQALEESRTPYFDGFAGARRPFFDPWAIDNQAHLPPWTRLWKLHGSVNWYQTKSLDVYRGTASEKDVRRVIHPSHLKYHESRRMPYLAMLDRLRFFLREPTAALVFCGCSFGDEHINEVLLQGLQQSPTAVAFALQYEDIDCYPKAVALAIEQSNLNVLARDGGVIGGRRTKWIEQPRETVEVHSGTTVTWNPCNPCEVDGMYSPRLNLGNFHIFGEFLRRMVEGLSYQHVQSSDVT